MADTPYRAPRTDARLDADGTTWAMLVDDSPSQQAALASYLREAFGSNNFNAIGGPNAVAATITSTGSLIAIATVAPAAVAATAAATGSQIATSTGAASGVAATSAGSGTVGDAATVAASVFVSCDHTPTARAARASR